MSPAHKAFALLHALSREEIEDMPPFIRRRFAERCREVAEMADQPLAPLSTPRSGILRHLYEGERAQ